VTVDKPARVGVSACVRFTLSEAPSSLKEEAVRNKRAKPIRDTRTGEEYRSETEAGKALASEVGGSIQDNFVWFKLVRAFPDRFQTKNPEGEWVAMDHPTAPRGALVKEAKPIRDVITGVEYPSETEAGKALYGLVDGEINDNFVWFKILRAFPQRFRTRNAQGEWVTLDHPSAPRGTTVPTP
jgi:hypothetical protein